MSDGLITVPTVKVQATGPAQVAVSALPVPTQGLILPPQGRLTLASGTPVMTAAAVNASTVYYTPYHGAWFPLSDGTFVTHALLSDDLVCSILDGTKSPAPAAPNSVYDLFVWNDAGTPRLSRGPAWTNDITRPAGSSLQRLAGLCVNALDIVNGPLAKKGVWVGTIGTNAIGLIDMKFGGSAVGGSPGVLGLWNAYNRIEASVFIADTTDNWTYNGNNVWRVANNSLNNSVTYVCGAVEDAVRANYMAIISTGTSAKGAAAIGVDTIGPTGAIGTVPANTGATQCVGAYVGTPGLGVRRLYAIETTSASQAATFFGNGGSGTMQSCLTATIRW